MNYDRLLTRVFDKQEKKMVYQNKWNTFTYHSKNYLYMGVVNDRIIAQLVSPSLDHPDDGKLVQIPLKGRFIPMQCTGHQDTDNKLIYEDDWLDYRESNFNGGSSKFTGRVIWDKTTCAFIVYEPEVMLKLGNYGKQRFPEKRVALKCIKPIFVRGNRWENPELLEGKI